MVGSLLCFLFVILQALVCYGTKGDDDVLLQAAFAGDAQGVKEAIQQHNANPNVQDPSSGQTPLMGAVLRGHEQVVRLLLSEFGDVVDATIPEKDGYTPAHGAGFQGRAEIMKILVEYGIDVKENFHQDGYAPLHRACWGREQRHTDTVRVLGELGVDLALPSKKDGVTTCAEMTRNPATLALISDAPDL